MATYPIHIRPAEYSGMSDRIRQKITAQNKIASELEEHINKKFEERDEEVQEFLYTTVAEETGHSLEVVSRILWSVDHGDHGLTISRSQQV